MILGRERENKTGEKDDNLKVFSVEHGPLSFKVRFKLCWPDSLDWELLIISTIKL